MMTPETKRARLREGIESILDEQCSTHIVEMLVGFVETIEKIAVNEAMEGSEPERSRMLGYMDRLMSTQERIVDALERQEARVRSGGEVREVCGLTVDQILYLKHDAMTRGVLDEVISG